MKKMHFKTGMDKMRLYKELKKLVPTEDYLEKILVNGQQILRIEATIHIGYPGYGDSTRLQIVLPSGDKASEECQDTE